MTDEFLYSIWTFFEANLSKRTRKNYFQVVKNYVNVTNISPENLTNEAALKYFNYLTNKVKNNELSYNTAAMRLSVMRKLCDYIKYKKDLEKEPYINYFKEYAIPEKDKTLKEEDIPTDKELDNLLLLASEVNDSLFYIVLSLVIKCGLRTSEICQLTNKSIYLDKDNTICLKIDKQKKVGRLIKLPKDVDFLFKNYLQGHNIKQYSDLQEDDVQYIFMNKRNTNLKVRDAERLLKKYIRKGVDDKRISKEYTLQDIRHSAIKYMLLGGAGQDSVADYCGITERWMTRYNRVVNESSSLLAADLSVITIKPSSFLP